jgi:hypothetical protein
LTALAVRDQSLKNNTSLKALLHFSILIIAGVFTLCSARCFGQELLERRISFKAVNEPMDEVLGKISDLGGFSFSYSPDVVDIRGRVTYQANRQSVREILTELFKGKISFRERRKYIILQKTPVQEEEKLPENFQLNGYIIDNRTGEKLANASIYESVTLASTVSNQYGYYRIKLPTAPASIRLEVRKEEYIARSIAVPNRKDTYLPIELSQDTLRSISGLPSRISHVFNMPKPKLEIPQIELVSMTTVSSDTSRGNFSTKQYLSLKSTYQKVQNEFINAFASAKQAANTRNITDTLHRRFQASLLPFLGTNHHLSGNIVNDVSINFIAGYSLGVNAVEIGAIANVVRGNVRGFQLAGISNIVGNDLNGFQYANVVNVTLGNGDGFQGSHFINYIGRNFKGMQVAGVGNVVVGTLNGWQLSSGYNYANTVRRGRQIGLINYADSSATTPLGLFSYVRTNGYRRYEFAANEFNYFNFSFKTGVNRLYNIFTLGFNGLVGNKSLGTIGYGFGTAQNLGRGWMINADATGNIILLKGQRTDEIAAGMFRFTMAVEKKIGNRFALFAGPALSLFSGKYTSIINTDNPRFSPIWLGSKPDRLKNNFGWVGFQAGIRFCNRI